MINACVVGLGNRGFSLMKNVLMNNEDIRVVAVCDLYQDRVERAMEHIKEQGGEAKGFTDYKEAINQAGLGAVYVFTGWETHAEIAIYAMEKGIPVASEVGCEYSLENCHALVRAHERTGTPYMFMENCCWGKEEMLATAMARKGIFGNIVHCAGAQIVGNEHSKQNGRQNDDDQIGSQKSAEYGAESEFPSAACLFFSHYFTSNL